MRMTAMLALLLAVACACAGGEVTLTGKALDALSGNTITVLGGDNVPHVVRLLGVDALPKYEDPWGRKAKKLLDDTVARQMVRVSWSRKDELGYPLCTVMLGRRNLSLDMLRSGLVWRCTREKLPPAYAKAEQEARSAGRGIWAEDAAFTPPDEAAQHPKPVNAVTSATPKTAKKKR